MEFCRAVVIQRRNNGKVVIVCKVGEFPERKRKRNLFEKVACNSPGFYNENNSKTNFNRITLFGGLDQGSPRGDGAVLGGHRTLIGKEPNKTQADNTFGKRESSGQSLDMKNSCQFNSSPFFERPPSPEQLG